MKRQDWTLLAIATAEGDPLDPAQLQKSLFVLGREHGEAVGDDYHDFSPYHYGPFAKSVYRDAEALEQEGLVTITTSGTVNKYAATPEGMKAAEPLRREAPEAAVRYLTEIVNWARGLSFSALVRAIYARYPEQRANSVFQG